MSKTVINTKIDKDIKDLAQKTARDIGLSMSDVINASLRNFIRTREVVFSAVPHMTPEFEKIIGIIDADIVQKKNLSSRFSTTEKAIEYLDNL